MPAFFFADDNGIFFYATKQSNNNLSQFVNLFLYKLCFAGSSNFTVSFDRLIQTQDLTFSI